MLNDGRLIVKVVVVTGASVEVETSPPIVICRRLSLKGPRPTAVAAAILMRYVVPGEIPISVVRVVVVGDEETLTHCSVWAPPSAT